MRCYHCHQLPSSAMTVGRSYNPGSAWEKGRTCSTSEPSHACLSIFPNGKRAKYLGRSQFHAKLWEHKVSVLRDLMLTWWREMCNSLGSCLRQSSSPFLSSSPQTFWSRSGVLGWRDMQKEGDMVHVPKLLVF